MSPSTNTGVSEQNTPQSRQKSTHSSGTPSIFMFYRSDKAGDFRRVLDSLGLFDAARHIDGVGLGAAYGAGHIAGSQAAREDGRPRHALRHEAPIERAARSTPEILVVSVEHPRRGSSVRREVF